MSTVTRSLALIAGVVGLVAALAGLVREVALASDEAMTWTEPSWWHDLVVEGGGATAVAAAVASGLTVLFLILAVRQFTGAGEPRLSRVQTGEGAAVSVAALQRLVARRLNEAVRGIGAAAVRLKKAEDGWRATVAADVAAEDLPGLQARAAQVADAELRQATGEAVQALDLETRRLVRPYR